MPLEQVHCTRVLTASAADVWAVLRDFDLTWHPYVTRCTLLRDEHGGILRDFDTADGGRLVERRSYISDSDRVLCYTAVSGIDGALNYAARIEVKQNAAGCALTWRAEITARADRAKAIAEGTKATFEAAFDALPAAMAQRPKKRASAQEASTITEGAIDGAPRLSYLTSHPQQPDSDTLVLFMHGIGGHASNWSAQIAALGASYRVAALNLRGYGNSTRGDDATKIDDYCNDINAMCDHFKASRVVLVGLSMGSWIATSYAMRHSDKLAGLVLAGGCTGMSEAAPEERATFLSARETPLQQGQTPADFADDVVQLIAGPNAGADVRAALHASMSAIPADTYRDALACFCAPVEQFEFANITCPVLMVTGAHDRLAPPDEIRQVAGRIFASAAASHNRADVRFEVLSDAGHLCNLEQPERFNHLLGSFLSRLPHVGADYRASRDEKQRAKRQRILRAAHAEFCQVGFDGASMDRLAKAADVSKPTLYQYFGGKDGLFAAVLEEGRAHITAPLVSGAGTLVDRLWRFSWTYADYVLRPDMLSLARLILGEAGRRPESAVRYHQSGPAQAFEGLVEFVASAQANGELNVDDPRLAANDLWSLILSGPRDHFLHYVNERPSEADLLKVIGHGLGVFLKAYSNAPEQDQQALAEKILTRKHAPQAHIGRSALG